MPLLVSFRFSASSTIFLVAASFKSKPSIYRSSALIYPVKCSPPSHGIHSLVLSSLPPLGKSIVLETTSKSSAKAALEPVKYMYPDPNPEFARVETQKFRVALKRRLLKNKETFGNDIEQVVSVCSEIFSNFLSKEYGGPGTLLVEPFTDMLLALKSKKLPGAPVAARSALLWAQNNVDRDWEILMSQPSK